MNKVVPPNTYFTKYCIHFNKLRILNLHTFVSLRVEDRRDHLCFAAHNSYLLLFWYIIYFTFPIFSKLFFSSILPTVDLTFKRRSTFHFPIGSNLHTVFVALLKYKFKVIWKMILKQSLSP